MPTAAKKTVEKAVEEKPAAKPTEETKAEPKKPADPTRCVVDDGTCVGRAVNGRVCSAHAVSHKSDGTPR